MRYISQFAFASILFTTMLASADELIAKSAVSSVTLFSDRAEVTRTSTLQLPKGRHTVVFDGVPAQLSADSLRAAGKGAKGTIIEGVEFRTRYRKEDISKRAEELNSKIESIEREIALQESIKQRVERQKNLVVDVSLDQNIPESGDKNLVRPRNSSEMSDILRFISDAEAKLDNEARAASLKSFDLNKDLSVLKNELNALQPAGRNESVVEVGITAAESSQLNLDITYQVYGASWSPAYNLLVDGVSDYQIETFGVISQRTGEDWENVSLTLSTARPNIGLNRPNAYAHILDIYQPISLLQKKTISSSYAYRADMPGMEDLKEEAAMDPLAGKSNEMPASAPQEIMQQSAEMSRYGAISFKIPTSVSLKSDGSREKVKVTQAKLSGETINVAVPALSQAVYKEASVENISGSPLLPGPVNVFDHGNFIGKQQLDYIPENKQIKLPIGVSDNVVVTRKLVKKFEDDPGIVRSFRRITQQWEVEMENLSAESQKVIVLDGLPLSQNEKIKVSINSESPRRLQDNDQNRIQNDAGVGEWHVTLKGKEKSKITFETSVEFPSDITVSGLE